MLVHEGRPTERVRDDVGSSAGGQLEQPSDVNSSATTTDLATDDEGVAAIGRLWSALQTVTTSAPAAHAHLRSTDISNSKGRTRVRPLTWT